MSKGAIRDFQVVYVSDEKPTTNVGFLQDYGDILTVSDVSEILHLCPKSIRELCKQGEIDAVKFGSSWRISKPALISYFDN